MQPRDTDIDMKIIEVIHEGKNTFGEIYNNTKCARATLSTHLRDLEKDGTITRELRKGRPHYSINLAVVQKINDYFNSTIDEKGKTINSLKKLDKKNLVQYGTSRIMHTLLVNTIFTYGKAAIATGKSDERYLDKIIKTNWEVLEEILKHAKNSLNKKKLWIVLSYTN